METIRATVLAESTHVLSIGISTYADPEIKDLPAAEGEALELAAAFRDPTGCAIPEGQVKTLEVPATSSAIVDALKEVSSACNNDSILIIYFSGHAFRDVSGIYLCGTNAKLQDLQRTSLSGTALADALSSCPARGILLILDRCVSAGFAENAPEFFLHTQDKDFRVLLAASRENELSWEIGNGEAIRKARSLDPELVETISSPAVLRQALFNICGKVHRTLLARKNKLPPTYTSVLSAFQEAYERSKAAKGAVDIDTYLKEISPHLSHWVPLMPVEATRIPLYELVDAWKNLLRIHGKFK